MSFKSKKKIQKIKDSLRKRRFVILLRIISVWPRRNRFTAILKVCSLIKNITQKSVIALYSKAF